MKIGEKVRPTSTWYAHMDETPEHRGHQYHSGKITDITKDWIEVQFFIDGEKLRYPPQSLETFQTTHAKLESSLRRMRIRVSQLAASSQVESLARSHRERGIHENPFPDLYKKFQPLRAKKYDTFLRKRHRRWIEPYFSLKLFLKSKVLHVTTQSLLLLERQYEDNWKKYDDELKTQCLLELILELLWEKDLFLDSELLRLIETKDISALKERIGNRPVFRKYYQ